MKHIDDCDVERILGTVRTGLGPVVANVQQKLLRRPRGGEPGIPRWIPDRVARNHVGALNVLAEAVKAQNQYASIDKDVAIAVATAATLGAGGLVKLATMVGSEAVGAALAQTAVDAALLGAALNAVDLGFMANNFAEYSDALAEVRLAEGMVVVGGDARLKQAREDAENKAFNLQLGSAMVAAGGVVSGIQAVRTSAPAKAASIARSNVVDAPPTPPGGAGAKPAPLGSSSATPPVNAGSGTKPAAEGTSGGLFDRPEFKNLPDKTPAESPNLEDFMTPEELAARPPGSESPQSSATAQGAGSATAATVLETGRTRQSQSGSKSAGPTGTAVDPARVRPESAADTSLGARGDYAIDLDKPGGLEKLDEKMAATRQAAEQNAPTEGGTLSRPEFQDLPKKPQAEPPDLDAYRTPEELAERGRLKQMDTAALPAAQPEIAAPAAVTPDAIDLPAATESRIARAEEDTIVNPPDPETRTRPSGLESKPATKQPASEEDRLAESHEETDVLPVVPDTTTSLPSKNPKPAPKQPVEPEARLAEPDEVTDVMPAARDESPEIEDRLAEPHEETDVMSSVPNTRTPSRPQPATPQAIKPPERIDRSTGERYYVVDSSNPRFVATGEVHPSRGELTIDIRTVLEDGTRSPVLRGAEEFQNIVNFFRGQFTRIKGNWQYGSNLAEVNRLTGPPHNLSLEKAVTRTWTADQARNAGYLNVIDFHANGTPGNYTEVQVIFGR